MQNRRIRAKAYAAICILMAVFGGAACAAPDAVFSDFRYEGHQPLTHPLHPTPREYVNPILAGSRSDPSIVRVGNDYYLANASMGYWPGQPIWHSRDLVHWQLIISAITRTDQLDLSHIDPGWQGIWAPDLKYHDGWFYLVNTCYDCGGLFAMRARHVAGPWPKPVFLPLTGIDPAVFFASGKAYVVFNGPPPDGAPDWDGHRAIWLQEIDPATMALRGKRTLLVDGGTHPPDHPFWIEGPHLFRKGDYFYLIAAQGGTNEHHSEVVFRSHDLLGPYEADPNPILSQDGLDPKRADPVVNAGHADFVQTRTGEWWAVFLGARPYAGSELNVMTGRDTFLLPVTWRDGWPIILPADQAVPLIAPRPNLANAPVADWPTAGDYTILDRFTGKLSPRWSLMRSSNEQWWHVGGGMLTITPRPIELGAAQRQPSLIALRQAHQDVDVTVTVRFAPAHTGDRAGLAVVQDPGRWFFLAVTGEADGQRALQLFRRAGDGEPVMGVPIATARLPLDDTPVRLRVQAQGPTYRFAYRTTSEGWHPLGGDQDGAMLGTRLARGFTGVVLGPAAIAAQ